MKRAESGRFLAGVAAFGVFIFGWVLPSAAHTAKPTGTVMGGIVPCDGIGASPAPPLHFVAGTVVVLRGSVTLQTLLPGKSSL